MRKEERRTVLKSVLMLPFFATAAKGQLAAETSQKGPLLSAEDYQMMFLGVRILRHVNTAQGWYRNQVGRYDSIRMIKDSEAMQKLLKSPHADRAGIGANLHSHLRFDDKEIVPGWQFKLGLNEDGSGYVTTMTPVDNESLNGLSSSEKGVIYEGRVIADGEHVSSLDPVAALNEPTQIKSTKSPGLSRTTGWLRTLALGAALPGGDCFGCRFCGGSYPCCCYQCCSCQQVPIGNCINCGCSCIWCCCIY
jgi:hypothetical protein